MDPARRPARFAALLLLALAVAVAAPALVAAPVALWGDSGDAWQNLWNGWWFAEAVASGHSPFYTHHLWYPDGVSLWLQTFGPLNAAATALLSRLLPGFLGYDLVVLGHLFFGAFAAWWLCDRLLGEAGLARGPVRLLAALAGAVVFGFSPYVWAHLSVHLHLSSIGFLALFAGTLPRAADPKAGWRPLLGAGLLALCLGLCGWYLVLDAALLGAVFLLLALARAPQSGLRPALRLAGAGLLAGLLLLPLLVPTLLALREPVEGAHDPVTFSTDLLSLWLPTPKQWLGRYFLETTTRFTGNAGENGGYLGYLPLAATGLALWRRRTPALVGLGLAGLAGVVLSFGPHPHLAGAIHREVLLPYAALARMLPFLGQLGCPVRLGLLGHLALAAGTALGVSVLLEALSRRRTGPEDPSLRPPWRLWAAGLLALALLLVEYAPAGQPTHRYPRPAFLEALGQVPPTGAIADLTGWTHPLYNQMLHGWPIVHGYVSRRPLRLVRRLMADPVLGPLYEEALYGRAPRQRALTRIDGPIDFDWGEAPPAPGVQADFEAEWVGQLRIDRPGRYAFRLGSDDDAVLYLDGRRVVDNSGAHPFVTREGEVTLAGPPTLRLTFRDRGGAAAVRLWWRPPGAADWSIVPREALHTRAGAPGLEGVYTHRAARPRLRGEAAARHLRARWGIAYLIAYEGRSAALSTLGLERVGAAQGIELWQVPGPASRPDPAPAGDR